jgi:CheY-like chemotaxis protein
MGGDLGVESTVGAGSRFQVRVPLPAVRSPQPATDAAARIIGYRGRRRTLLIVDDQPQHRDWLAGALRPLGFGVSESASGAACLAQAANLAPDAILIDLIMPEMDGLETTRRLRAAAATRTLPVIALSANAFDEDRERSLAAGCDEFLPKPVDLGELLAALRRRLSIEWIEEHVAAPDDESAERDLAVPPAAQLGPLLDAARIGYVRGLLEQIDRIERLDARYAPFAGRLRQLTQEFRLNEITEQVTARLEARHVHA